MKTKNVIMRPQEKMICTRQDRQEMQLSF